MKKLTDFDVDTMFYDFLEEVQGMIKISNLSFHPAQILEKLDNAAYGEYYIKGEV